MPVKYIEWLIRMGLALSIAIPGPSLAQNFYRGQRLYEDHCDACHDSLTHPGKEQKVHSLSELRQRIASWAEHTRQYWGDSDIDDVSYFLNQSFYHFDEQKR
jgi:mono/diheme cytochrome c family protein